MAINLPEVMTEVAFVVVAYGCHNLLNAMRGVLQQFAGFLQSQHFDELSRRPADLSLEETAEMRARMIRRCC